MYTILYPQLRRRTFAASLLGSAGVILAGSVEEANPVSDPVAKLKPMIADVPPISKEERTARCEKARRLMAENQLDAVFWEPGPA